MFWQTAYASSINLPQASTVASRVDALHDFLWWLSLISLAGVTIALILFAKKYHRSNKGRETAYILGSHTLELAWTIIPLILMLFVFAWGYRDFLFLRSEPKDPVEINVVGRQWMWNFEYANGRKTLNEFYMPKGKPVKLIMTSEDVIHSFFIPNFRLKYDVVPGQYTYLSFEPTLTGEHAVRCAEMCGTGHSDMLAKAIVLEPKDFDHWLQTGKVSGVAKYEVQTPQEYMVPGTATPPSTGEKSSGAPKSLAEKGKDLYTSKGCFACHTTDGTTKIGPTFLHAFGRTEELQDGSKVTVDENYIRESLLEPQAKLVKGFPPSMPPFKGVLTEDEISSLIAYIKSLK
jgi:cytochrome c oxidase subunit 2